LLKLLELSQHVQLFELSRLGFRSHLILRSIGDELPDKRNSLQMRPFLPYIDGSEAV
jgi:hypothetical protein